MVIMMLKIALVVIPLAAFAISFLMCLLAHIWFLVMYAKIVARLSVVRPSLGALLKNQYSRSHRKSYRWLMLLFICNARMAHDKTVNKFGLVIMRGIKFYAINSFIALTLAFAAQVVGVFAGIIGMLDSHGLVVMDINRLISICGVLFFFVWSWIGRAYLKHQFRIVKIISSGRSVKRSY